MTREFIKNLFPDCTKEALDQIMTEHGKGVEAQKNTVATLTTERDGLRAQLDTAQGEIKSFQDMDIDGIRARATQWEEKHATDTKALQDQLEATKYAHLVEGAVGGFRFSSASAKKAFLADLTAQKLPVQEGKLLGLDEFQKQYATTDPEAFVTGGKVPTVTGATGGSNHASLSSGDALRAAFGLTTQKQ